MIENKNRNAEEARSIQVAEESRELDWKSKSFIASLFMGDLDIRLADPFPGQDPADKVLGDEICARVDAWARENIDGEEIDRTEEIPAHVWKGLAELGLFGIKIPKKYGGLGMSQSNYMRILGVIARYCASVCATLSAHQSIGVPQPLKLFGTDEQKQKYLPRFARGEVSAFALTELSVGSDPANMSTNAVLSEDGKHWILNGEKLWCSNGVVADVIVVMARTPPIQKNGREVKQITAFIVETDWQGVDVMHRCHFMGLRALENGLIRFTQVKVPVDNVIGGVGQGLKLALSTLNDGRLSIPAMAAVGGNEIAEFSAKWAKSRVQWGKAVGDHEAGADKLAFIVSSAYAMETLSDYCAALSDRGDVDIRMEAATAKMFNTEVFWTMLDVGIQLRGGRGFETQTSLEARGEAGFPFERMMRDARINRIIEGTTDVMHLFLAREALDKHLTIAGGLFKKGGLGDKVGTLLKCAGYYPFWYLKTLMGGLFTSFGRFDPALAKGLKAVDRRTRRLARALFHRMVLMGPKLEMRQNVLGRIVDIGAELAVMALVAARAQKELDRGDKTGLEKATYWIKARTIVVDQLFAALSTNTDAAAVSLSKSVMATAELLPEVSTDHLTPIAHDVGKDLTTGRVQSRTAEVSAAAK